MDAQETIEYKGLSIKLYQDEDAISPNDWDSGPDTGVFIVTTKNREFEVIPKGYSVDEITEHMRTHKLYHGHKVYPLYAYVHSGVALSLGRQWPFDCPWDSGQIGFVLVKRGIGVRDFDSAAQSVVETWNQYLSGDVWGISIQDSEDNVLDSCWGFYGFEYAKKEAMEMAESTFQAEQVRKLSYQI